jgi:hypothetical protein
MMKKERRVNEQGHETLQCSTCKKWKVVDNFHAHGKNKDGSTRYHHECKECRNNNNKEVAVQQGIKSRKRERQVNEQGQELLYCTSCREWKVSDDFTVYGKNKDGMTLYLSWCKDCYNQKAKERNARKEKKERSGRRERRLNDNGLKTLYCPDCKMWRVYDDFRVIGKNKNNTLLYGYTCKECGRKRLDKWNEAHPENKRVNSRKRYHVLKDEICKARREQRQNSETRPAVLLQDAKHAAKRRGIGWEPLNAQFENSHGHHLGTDPYGNHDPDTVIYIPKSLHSCEQHSPFHIGIKLNQGMIKITKVILKWYQETYPKDIKSIEYLQQVLEATKERVANGWENAMGWDEWLVGSIVKKVE